MKSYMKILYLTLMSLFFFGCTALKLKTFEPLVITHEADWDTYVGRVITLRGLVTNTKIASILGVEVYSGEPNLRGEIAEATGILKRRIITEKDVADPNVPSKGPGTFYRLTGADSKDVQVRQISQHE